MITARYGGHVKVYERIAFLYICKETPFRGFKKVGFGRGFSKRKVGDVTEFERTGGRMRVE